MGAAGRDIVLETGKRKGMRNCRRLDQEGIMTGLWKKELLLIRIILIDLGAE